MDATWATHFHSVSGLMRVLMTHALTRLDRVGNTSDYLKCRVSAKTEEQRKNVETWRKMYVSCGCDHDPITRLLMCEGECTCSEDSNTCVLGKIIIEVEFLLSKYYEWMQAQVGMSWCPHIHPPSQQCKKGLQCDVCGGKGKYFDPTEEWYIKKSIQTFWISAMCCTGHTIECIKQPCLCTEPATCKVCEGRRYIDIKRVRIATAQDILTKLKEFDEGEIFNDASHPSFVIKDVETKLLQASTPIILPAFRPILSTLVLFTVAYIPDYREHYVKTYPLSSRRINRAMSAMSQCMNDMALNSNQDGIGHPVGNTYDTYQTNLAKLQIVLYKYLYMGWNSEEYQIVMEK